MAAVALLAACGQPTEPKRQAEDLVDDLELEGVREGNPRVAATSSCGDATRNAAAVAEFDYAWPTFPTS